MKREGWKREKYFVVSLCCCTCVFTIKVHSQSRLTWLGSTCLSLFSRCLTLCKATHKAFTWFTCVISVGVFHFLNCIFHSTTSVTSGVLLSSTFPSARVFVYSGVYLSSWIFVSPVLHCVHWLLWLTFRSTKIEIIHFATSDLCLVGDCKLLGVSSSSSLARRSFHYRIWKEMSGESLTELGGRK